MRKRILIMTNGLYSGGAEKILQTILSNIDKNKYIITLYGLHQEELKFPYTEDIQFRYIFSHGLHRKNNRFNKFITALCNKIKLLIYYHCSPKIFYKLFVRGVYDVEIAFLEGYSTRIISGSNGNSKKLAWVHIDLKENHWSLIGFRSPKEELQSYHKFNTVFCVSENVKSSVEALFGSDINAKVLYNPIDDKEISAKARQDVDGLQITHERFRFLTIGRLVPQKGYDRLIPIINRLVKNGFPVEVWILGEGYMRSELENMIVEYGLQDNVILLGFQDNPYAYFKYCDAFVCSSRSEGYSTVVTEALILGMPVVTTNCSGMVELLGENSEYGIITANDDDALYQGMKNLMDTKCLEHYKEQSSKRGKCFNLSSLMNKLEEAL